RWTRSPPPGGWTAGSSRARATRPGTPGGAGRSSGPRAGPASRTAGSRAQAGRSAGPERPAKVLVGRVEPGHARPDRARVDLLVLGHGGGRPQLLEGRPHLLGGGRQPVLGGGRGGRHRRRPDRPPEGADVRGGLLVELGHAAQRAGLVLAGRYLLRQRV